MVTWDDNVTRTVAVEPLAFRTLPDARSLPVETTRMEAAPVDELAIDLEVSLREAHERGHREATETLRLEVEQRLAEERASVSRVVAQFEQEKQRYFSEVEGEVVRLSLAIAERVLHREAKMDPTLLAGAARVALEQVADHSEAVLHVAAEDAVQWNETLCSADAVQIETDHHLAKGEAVLKTRAGSVQLGLQAQLREIERGFFELLHRRPVLAA